MIPKLLAIAHLIKLRNSYTIFVCRNMLCNNIHSHFRKIHIAPHSCCCSYPCRRHNIQDNLLCKLIWCQPSRQKITGNIHKYLINGIHMNVFWCHIFQIYIINSRTIFQVICHPWRCRNITNLQFWMFLQFFSIAGSPCKFLSRNSKPPFCIHLLQSLNHLKKSGSPRNTIFL